VSGERTNEIVVHADLSERQKDQAYQAADAALRAFDSERGLDHQTVDPTMDIPAIKTGVIRTREIYVRHQYTPEDPQTD